MNIKIVNLEEYLKNNQLDELQKQIPDFTPNGRAILFGEVDEFKISKELLNLSNLSIRRMTKALDVNLGQIDDNSKNFIVQYTLFNESLINSSSFRNNNFNGLYEFDKIELKEKLLKLVEIL